MEGVEKPIYYISRIIRGPKVRYAAMEALPRARIYHSKIQALYARISSSNNHEMRSHQAFAQQTRIVGENGVMAIFISGI